MSERQEFIEGGLMVWDAVGSDIIHRDNIIERLKIEAAARYPDKRCGNKLPLSSIAAARDALMARIEEKQYMQVPGLTGYRACFLEEAWKKHLETLS